MPPSPSRILIVDDASVVRESLGWLIADEPDFAVVGDAANGTDALDKALTLTPDLVLLDIELPDLDGFSVTRRLKALPNPPLVILLSVHDGAEYKQRGAEAGCDAYVEKGSGWMHLLTVLQDALSKRPASS